MPATIHLMNGFIGFGKTTIAKELEQKLSAVRFTHDDIMLERYGARPDDFETKYKLVDEYIRSEAAKCVRQGKDVIMDYGFWTHSKRNEYYEWAMGLTQNVIFHVVCCDMNIAKKRNSLRNKNGNDTIFIDNDIFDVLLQNYEPWDEKDTYPAVFHNADSSQYIGYNTIVYIDRPKGSKHPKYDYTYPINYGFIPYTISGDGEELDAYVLGVDEAIEKFVGTCVAVIHRFDDNDDKLVIIPQGTNVTNEEIEKSVGFQEKWFKHTIIRK